MMIRSKAAPDDAKRSAQRAGLVHVTDSRPGIGRRSRGRDFEYFDQRSHRLIKDESIIRRIKSLAIPPAWTDVWICKSDRGHLQATGRDARGRKQHRYHPKFRQSREEEKFDHVLEFAQALPKIRNTVAGHLRKPELSREKVLAAIVSLLERTLIRVGNDEYAQSNGSFGLTTLENEHVRVRGKRIRFDFKGKSSVEHTIELESAALARVIRKCAEMPEKQLFEYIDENGQRRDVKSSDVNSYLREITGHDFTAKDFRTWFGTVLAAEELRKAVRGETQKQLKASLLSSIDSVAKQLGNTRAVCRKCYIHPAIVDSFLDGSMHRIISDLAQKKLASSRQARESAVIKLIRSATRSRP